MTHMRMDENTINASLDACLHEAQKGNTYQARKLHEMLDSMLTERELPSGRLWLTDHGKKLLADMHRELSHCEGCGKQLQDTVLDAVQLKPHPTHWHDTSTYLSDLRVALAVATELREHRDEGNQFNVDQAIRAVAASGEFPLTQCEILEIYDDITSSVNGFQEISNH